MTWSTCVSFSEAVFCSPREAPTGQGSSRTVFVEDGVGPEVSEGSGLQSVWGFSVWVQNVSMRQDVTIVASIVSWIQKRARSSLSSEL